jgi:hypothetical protein
MQPFISQLVGHLRFVSGELSRIIPLLVRPQEEMAVERHPGLDAACLTRPSPETVRKTGIADIPKATGKRWQPGTFQLVSRGMLLPNPMNQDDLRHLNEKV